MIPVYCISGLGADERVFSKLALKKCSIHFIKWILPQKNESIESYANRLCDQIKDKDPILIGVSFGGIMAIEIAKIIPCKKIFLISSIKQQRELPLWIKLTGSLKINRIIPYQPKGFLMDAFENYFLSPESQQEKELMHSFRVKADIHYIRWALDKIISWTNVTIPAHTVHILGDRDKFFSIKKANPDFVIKTGAHFMVYNRAIEISNIIQNELESL